MLSPISTTYSYYLGYEGPFPVDESEYYDVYMLELFKKEIILQSQWNREEI